MTKPELTAESYRIRAIAHFMAKDLARARLEISKAVEMEPSWESIRFVAAMIDYFSALAEPAIPKKIVRWPEPVDWSMVKRDDTSIARLREAAKVFDELSTRAERRDEDRRAYETWRLACLANDPERQEEAESYCNVLLEANAANAHAIVWASARSYGIALDASRRAIEELLAAGTIVPHQVIALITCYLDLGEEEQALGLLDKTRSRFEEFGAEDLWTSWQVQLLVMMERTDEAIEFLDAQDDVSRFRDARTFALVANASISNNWQPVIDHVDGCYQATKDPKFLLEACELSARNGDWDYVAERSDLLLDSVYTAEAVRLAATAAFKVRRYADCVELIDGQLDVFRNRTPPPDVRRLRAFCQRALGILPEAIAELELLIQDQPSTENLVALAQLYLEKGEFKGLALVTRRLEGRADLSVETSLSLARAVCWEDEDLARSLWRKSAEKGIPDPLVGEALTLGFQLGLDAETKPLIERMQALGLRGEGGVQVKSIDEMASFAIEHRDQTTHLNTLYKSGRVPIHAIAASLNTSPAYIYRGLMAENELAPDPLGQASILVRHGGRAVPMGFHDLGSDNLQLVLDVTALLVAEHLQILSEVGRVYRPLHVPQDVVRSLIWMRERLTFHQPSRIDDYHQIIALADQGILKLANTGLARDYEDSRLVDLFGESWISMLEEARITNGYVVDFLPLRRFGLDDPLAALSEETSRHLVNTRAVVQALRDEGPFSASEFEEALDALGTEGELAPSGPIPRLGSRLFLSGNIPEVLAGAGVLQDVAEHFVAYVEPDEIARIRTALNQHSQMTELATWLDNLISKVSRGIDAGTYVLLPRGSTESEEDPEETNPLLATVRGLLTFDILQGHIIWADDRYLNSYFRRDAAPIIGVNEILKSLVSKGALEPADYYGKITDLRAGNARFIPVQVDEIIHQLEAAKVKNGRILETRDLSILRRYFAACLLQGEILQRPPVPEAVPNKQGEIAFVIGSVRSIIEAVVEIWARSSDEAMLSARLDWLLANLYIDHLGAFNVTSLRRPESEDLFLAATSLAGLLSQAITVSPLQSEGAPSLRRDYFDWLHARILQSRIESDPAIVPAVAEILKKSLLDAHSATTEQEESIPATILLQSFVQDLPGPIRNELSQDPDFMAQIGFRSSVVVENIQFEPDAFWQSASHALNGEASDIRPLNLDRTVVFEPWEDEQGQRLFRFKHPDTGEQKVIAGEELGLLVNSPSEREAFLRQNSSWFDCPNGDFDEAVAEIASIEDPHLRIQKAESWRDSSVAVFYDRLLGRLRETASLDLTGLRPPDGNALLRHFGFQEDPRPNQGFQQLLDAASQELTNRVGLPVALQRLAGFPVPLQSLTNGLLDWPMQERRAAIRQLLKNPPTPLSRIHLVHILSQSRSDSAAYTRLCRWLTSELLSSDGSRDIDAFIAMLNWVHEDFGRWPDARDWPTPIRLSMAWAHTNRLYSILSQVGAPAHWIREIFSEPGQRLPYDMFEPESDYRQDVAHSRMVSSEALLFGGLSYAVEGAADSILNQSMREMISTRAFSLVNGREFPNLLLLRDPTQAQDSLGSFLAGDRGQRLKPLIGPDRAKVYSRASLEQSAQEGMARLDGDDRDRTAWGELFAILGNLPPYRSISHDLAGVLRNADYVGLCKEDIHWGLIAIQFASLQFAHIDDDKLGSHLNAQLGEVAAALAIVDLDGSPDVNISDTPEPLDQEVIHALLIEAAANVCVGESDNKPEEAVQCFRDTVRRMVQSWEEMRQTAATVIQRLIEGLPATEGKELWRLLLEFRTS